jgi:hypothetical protein
MGIKACHKRKTLGLWSAEGSKINLYEKFKF